MQKPLRKPASLFTFVFHIARPWQRGAEENINGLIRQYLPKGTDLSLHSQEGLDKIAFELNMRPQKRFDFKCTIEVMSELMSKYHESPSTIQGLCCTKSLHPSSLLN